MPLFRDWEQKPPQPDSMVVNMPRASSRANSLFFIHFFSFFRLRKIIFRYFEYSKAAEGRQFSKIAPVTYKNRKVL